MTDQRGRQGDGEEPCLPPPFLLSKRPKHEALSRKQSLSLPIADNCPGIKSGKLF